MRAFAAALGAAAWLCACAGPDVPLAPPGARRVLLELPWRADGAKRGAPAALAAVMSFWGRDTRPEELEEELDRDSFRASLAGDLQRAAQARGFSAELMDATLAQVRAQLDEGRPLLALVDTGPPFLRAGRWLVIAGYDEDRRALYALSGRGGRRLVPYELFFARWGRTRRAALLVRPANCPACGARGR